MLSTYDLDDLAKRFNLPTITLSEDKPFVFIFIYSNLLFTAPITLTFELSSALQVPSLYASSLQCPLLPECLPYLLSIPKIERICEMYSDP